MKQIHLKTSLKSTSSIANGDKTPRVINKYKINSSSLEHTQNNYFFSIILYLVIIAFSYTTQSVAQSSPNKSEEILKLISNQKKTIIIDSLSLSHYSEAFIPALADNIADQELVITTQGSAPEDFKAENSWINSSLKGGTRVLKDNTAMPNPENPRNSAFGSFDEIQEEESEVKTRATKLLWNTISRFEANRFVDIKINLSWASTNSTSQENISARIVTAYPATLVAGQTLAMRERLNITEPNWLSNFAFLTLRQYGKNEDLLWISSPSLQTTRELTGSLRGDLLFDSLIALDDLLIFSGKPELLEANILESFETLVPFASSNFPTNKSSDSEATCINFTSSSQENSNPLSSIFFSPRKVFVLELKQKDPYSQIGRQKLYIDKLSMLPFFKEVYTQDGKLAKTILGVFGIYNVATPNMAPSTESHFIPHSIIAFGKPGEMTTLKTSSGRTCSAMPKDISAKFFDPSELAILQKSLPKQNTTPTSH